MALLALSAATAVLGAILLADAQAAGTGACRPCSKILTPVCGIDRDGEHKSFGNPCMLEWCNCILEEAGSDREFAVKLNKKCTGYKTNETTIPECFPEEGEEEDGGEGEGEGEEGETEDVTGTTSEATTTSRGGSPGSRTVHNSTSGNHTGAASPLIMANSHLVLSLSATMLVLLQLF